MFRSYQRRVDIFQVFLIRRQIDIRCIRDFNLFAAKCVYSRNSSFACLCNFSLSLFLPELLIFRAAAVPLATCGSFTGPFIARAIRPIISTLDFKQVKNEELLQC